MAKHLGSLWTVVRRSMWLIASWLFVSATLTGEAARAQDAPPTFRSSVDLVRVTAVVRDRKGRFVQDLSARDFEILDNGRRCAITDFRRDTSGISVALLFDASGSMESRLAHAHDAARHVLAWLDPGDEAAIFAFDTVLEVIAPFTPGLKDLPESMSRLAPFGATSLHDAIAQTAERLGAREGRRRAVVVFTDGRDNASRLPPERVAAMASEIDVPVYIVGIVPVIDQPGPEAAGVSAAQSPLGGQLVDLTSATGGHVFVTSSPSERSVAARRIVDELRHQYLMTIESSGRPGWHPLVVRARDKELTVRARTGYFAGQSRPNAD
jgi:VWFA-related protein